LQVLDALRSSPASSLQSLHDATRLPKPTLLRILATLMQAGLVSRRSGDGLYRFSDFAGSARKRDRHDRLADAAAPVLDNLCQKVLWPSDLMVAAGDHMERRETSQASSPFFPHRTYRNRVGQPVNWLLSGVGRAYLAFCPEQERDRIVRRLRNSEKPEDQLARDPKRLDGILADVRRKGYAARDPIFAGGSYGQLPRDDRLSAIAVPIVDRKRVLGSINILWIKTAFTVEDFAVRHLGDLQQAARDIVNSRI
jgi:IclR family mhp operon transcriptional activator